ncbi:MAG: hypothetical protein KDB01_21880 [Planctomycetaceae bacterium]|nr:hypothetical protein [Planctomycetaceae bacterium]
MSIFAKSWLVVIGAICLQIAVVLRIHVWHGSIPLSAILTGVSIVVAVAIGERAYRYFKSSQSGGA